ncbi:hypothetical protein BDV12DRAFT_201319 [Aspergillus spectabilis]
MLPASSHVRQSATANLHQGEVAPPSAKRRRVRKGTRSCWECKRRKIRCLFAAADDAICIGCQDRRVPCVSQEMPEDLSPARKGSRHLYDRISRIEDAMKHWLAAGPPGFTHADEQRPPLNYHRRALPTPAESLGEPTPHSSSHAGYGEVSADPELTVLQHLLAALPASEDVQILLQESARPALYTELTNTQPRSKLTRENLAVARSSLAELPGPSSHPVLLAKQMLLFAITLQSPCENEILGLLEPPSVLMRRLTTAVSRWVTTSDEMQGTVDGLICIMLEGIFETNAGNLRRAWAVYRRALTVAQLMGLHWSSRPPLPRIDPNLEADPECLWFRIVYADRYLSLLLGLPQGTSDQSMGSPALLGQEPPLGQFERHLTILASRILQRNEKPSAAWGDIATTQAIDAELLKVSQSMPASFWRPANFHQLTLGSPETLLWTVQLGAQIYYHGLLIHLHLPYMMHRVNTNNNNNNNITQHEYSKITCVNASREIMTRFIAHRSFNPMSSCSRPVDFFALLATMTLLLAHLDAHHHREATNCLAHQRLSDRAMLDQALERMDVISHLNKDVTVQQSAALIRRLLEIEADAAGGNRYTTQSINSQGGESSHLAVHTDKDPAGDELHLQVPYLGVIRIARDGPILRQPWLEGSVESRPRTTPMIERQHSLPRLHSPVQNSLTMTGDLRGLGGSTAQLPSSKSASRQDESSMLPYPNSNAEDMNLQPPMVFPAVTASVNDWAFQGVDMAFFDSLRRGTSCANEGAFEQ